MKPPIGGFPDPVAEQEPVTKAYGDANYSGVADSDAIHNNVAGEIAAIAEKISPVVGDHVLIEDSESGDVKKRALIGGLLNSAPLAAAQGDYISCRSGSSQTNIVVNDVIALDAIRTQQGGLALSGNQITGLKAGRTYQLLAQSRIDGATSPNGAVDIRWYNVTAASLIGTQGAMISQANSSLFSEAPQAFHIFTPDVDTTLEVRVTFASPAGMDLTSFGNYASVIEIGAVQADVIGGLEFMDLIEVTADQTSVSFGAAGDGAFQRALDGDVDEEYVLVSAWEPPAVSTANLEMRPNGVSTNQQTSWTFWQGSSPSSAQVSTLVVGRTDFTDNEHIYTEGSLYAKTGNRRMWRAQETINNTAGDANGRIHSGAWTETATNITSLDLVCTTASGIKIGSRFVLYRRTRTNLRADSAAVYERHAMETVDPGALATTERTVGHSIYGGSLVGVSLRVENPVTAGDITVNVKLDGVTALTAVLDTTNSTSHVVRAGVGVHKFAADKNVSVEFVPTSYDNTGSVASPVTVQVHMTNDALITPPAESGETYIDTIICGEVNEHDSATPKATRTFQLDPTEYDKSGTTRSLVFRAVAFNGGGVASTNVSLYNITDAETVATLNFTTATPTMKEVTLTEGSGAGEVDLSAKLYEARIFVDSPDAVDDKIHLGSSELRVISTVN